MGSVWQDSITLMKRLKLFKMSSLRFNMSKRIEEFYCFISNPILAC